MGGQGSGTWERWDRKDTVEEYHTLDVRTMHRRGWLRPGMQGKIRWLRGKREVASIGWTVWDEEDDDLAQEVELYYTVTPTTGNPEDLRSTVFLEWTRCNYGGHRPWFTCPNPACNRCVAILYGGPCFYCRHCHNLAYESQREDLSGRLRRKARKIRRRLGGSADLREDFPQKPTGMHWRTYHRLRQEAERGAASQSRLG